MPVLTSTYDRGVAQAKAQARHVLSEYGLERGGETDLRDLAYAQDLFVRSGPLHGAEGRLIQEGDRGVATISDAITHPGKRSFVIAHELGHFELHGDSPLFLCDEGDFVDWHRRRPEETEANQFAAELLMPAEWFDGELRREPLSLGAVSDVAEVASVSLTAAAFRCVELDVFPCALVFCRDDEIRWYKISESFPHSYVPHGDAPHPHTGAGEYFANGHTSPDPEPTPCNAWFFDDDIPADAKVLEQCQPMRHLNATLSLVWQP